MQNLFGPVFVICYLTPSHQFLEKFQIVIGSEKIWFFQSKSKHLVLSQLLNAKLNFEHAPVKNQLTL
jgi:hypothetical protein